jgi:hypothetical protein
MKHINFFEVNDGIESYADDRESVLSTIQYELENDESTFRTFVKAVIGKSMDWYYAQSDTTKKDIDDHFTDWCVFQSEDILTQAEKTETYVNVHYGFSVKPIE